MGRLIGRRLRGVRLGGRSMCNWRGNGMRDIKAKNGGPPPCGKLIE